MPGAPAVLAPSRLTNRRLARARRVDRWQRVDRGAPALNGGLNKATMCKERRPIGKKGVRLWMRGAMGPMTWDEKELATGAKGLCTAGSGRCFGVWADVFTAPRGRSE